MFKKVVATLQAFFVSVFPSSVALASGCQWVIVCKWQKGQLMRPILHFDFMNAWICCLNCSSKVCIISMGHVKCFPEWYMFWHKSTKTYQTNIILKISLTSIVHLTLLQISQIQSITHSLPDPSLHPHCYSGSVRLSHGVQFSEIAHTSWAVSLSIAYPLKMLQTQQKRTQVTKICNWNSWQNHQIWTLYQ